MCSGFRDDNLPASSKCPAYAGGQGDRHAPRQVLTEVSKGCRCRVRRHNACGAIRRRLLDLGLVPDAEVEMIRCATLGDPLELRVGGYFVVLRRQEADLIEVLKD